MKILIVEDNEILSNNIKTFLGLEGMDATQLFSGELVDYELTVSHYDLVILDIGLPGMNGVDVCQKIRENGKNIPVLMLTARSTKGDTLSGFRSGADDYLTKPFDYDELTMRIHALLRRSYAIKGNAVAMGDVDVYLDEKRVCKGQKEVHLSVLEMDLLLYLVHNAGRTISKEELTEKVWWEYDAFSMSRTLDVYIWYLRKKLGHELIETVRSQGYAINK